MIKAYYIPESKNISLLKNQQDSNFHLLTTWGEGDWFNQQEFLIELAKDLEEHVLVFGHEFGISFIRMLIKIGDISNKEVQYHWIVNDGEINGPITFDHDGKFFDWSNHPDYFDYVLSQLLSYKRT